MADSQKGLQGFLQDLEDQRGIEARASVEAIFDQAKGRGLRIALQKRNPNKGSSVAFVIPGLAKWLDATPLVLFTSGRLSWQLRVMRMHRPFNSRDAEDELRSRLSALPSTELEKPDWPDTHIEDVLTEEGRTTLVEILAWTVDRIRRSNPG